jgi:Mn-dependent DtxR family transcriptional regulator
MDQGDGIFMSKQEQFAYEMICAFQRGEMSREEVARLLETTPRNVSRISKRIKAKGMLGVKHGNTGKKPVNKTEKSVVRRVKALLQEHYFDFNICHAREMLKTNHDIDLKSKW